MYLSMIIILTDFHLLLAESILRSVNSQMLSYQFEECSPRGGYQYWNYSVLSIWGMLS